MCTRQNTLSATTMRIEKTKHRHCNGFINGSESKSIKHNSYKQI